MLTTVAETDYSEETERCCALLEAVLRGLHASNCQAVADRPGWETEMAKPSRREVSFTALLEEVQGDFRALADGVKDANRRILELDAKIDGVRKELSDRMDVGFRTVMAELRHHSHASP